MKLGKMARGDLVKVSVGVRSLCCVMARMRGPSLSMGGRRRCWGAGGLARF